MFLHYLHDLAASFVGVGLHFNLKAVREPFVQNIWNLYDFFELNSDLLKNFFIHFFLVLKLLLKKGWVDFFIRGMSQPREATLLWIMLRKIFGSILSHCAALVKRLILITSTHRHMTHTDKARPSMHFERQKI